MKLTDKETGIKVDLSFDIEGGLHAAEWINSVRRGFSSQFSLWHSFLALFRVRIFLFLSSSLPLFFVLLSCAFVLVIHFNCSSTFTVYSRSSNRLPCLLCLPTFHVCFAAATDAACFAAAHAGAQILPALSRAQRHLLRYGVFAVWRVLLDCGCNPHRFPLFLCLDVTTLWAFVSISWVGTFRLHVLMVLRCP